MKLSARLLALLVAISLTLSLGVGSSASSAEDGMGMASMALESPLESPLSGECGDCGNEKAMPCSMMAQCATHTAIMPNQVVISAVAQTFSYGKVDVDFLSHGGRPDPHPPKP